MENYILAGRKLTTPLITVSIVGLAIGGASTIGVSDLAYKVAFLPAGKRQPAALRHLHGLTPVLWQTTPAIRVLPQVIYMEWAVCTAAFLLVPIFDSNPIKTIALAIPASAEEAPDSV